MSVLFTPLPAGGVLPMTAHDRPDLAGSGWVEQEWIAAGQAPRYVNDDEGPLPADGRWRLRAAEPTPYATRILVRRPADPTAMSGTVVVEWLNVSSGQDTAPDWTYLAAELVRRGHAWVGISAQYVGVEGGEVPLAVAAAGGLKHSDPERYAPLDHPGDAWSYGIFADISRALRDPDPDGPLGGSRPGRVIAAGQSQSAYALTSYINGVHPLVGAHDGFLVHSRGGTAAPLGAPGRGLDTDEDLLAEATGIREDAGAPVVVVQTETEVLGRPGRPPGRQPDTDSLRVWEVAGSSHADRFLVADLEEFLGLPHAVNRGQQAYVVRAALRHLERWVDEGTPAPAGAPLEVHDQAFVVDEVGNARGGVRTPAVDAPVAVLTGFAPTTGAGATDAGSTDVGSTDVGSTDAGSTDVGPIAQLFGHTDPLPAERLAELYGDRDAWLAAYERATDAAIAAGFILPEDRSEVLAEADGSGFA